MATIEERKYKDKKTGKTIIRYRVKIRLKGFPPLEETFDRSTDAVEWAAKKEYELKYQAQFGIVANKTRTVQETLKRYGDSLKLTNPKRYEDVEPILAWWEKRIGKMRLCDLSKNIIIQQRELLKATHVRGDPNRPLVSNSWVNRVTTVLKRALNVAVDEWNWIGHNPAAGIKNLKEPPGRTRFLQKNEIDCLLAACKVSKNSDLFIIVVTGLITGGRRTEIAAMKLKDIDLQNKKILLPRTKNGKPRFLRIEGLAFDLIQKKLQSAEKDQVYLFPSPTGLDQPYDFDTAWNNALARAGVKDFVFHDLRHTAASLLAQNGAALHQIAEILGHSSLEVTKRYIHLLETDTSKLVEKAAERTFGHERSGLVERGELFLHQKSG